MAIRLASTAIEFTATGTRGVLAAVRGIGAGLKSIGGFGASIAGSIGGIGALGAAFGAATKALGPLVAALGAFSLVKAAAENEQAGRRFGLVFKDLTAAAQQGVDEIATSIGRNASDIQDSFTKFQQFFTGLGVGEKNALALSEQFSKLALDLASFTGQTDAEAVESLQRALAGAGKEMKKLGIDLKDLATDEEGLGGATDKAKNDMTELEKTLARVRVISEGLAKANIAGDAIRNQGFSAQFKKFKADFASFAEDIGTLLLPVAGNIVAAFRAIVDSVRTLIAVLNQVAPLSELFGKMFGDAANLEAVLATIRNLVRDLAAGFFLVSAEVASTLLNVLSDVVKTIADIVGLVNDDLAGSLRRFARDAVDTAKIIKKNNEEVAQSIIDAFGKVGQVQPRIKVGVDENKDQGKRGQGDAAASAAALKAPVEVFRDLQASAAKGGTLDAVVKQQGVERARAEAEAKEQRDKQTALLREQKEAMRLIAERLAGRIPAGTFAP